MIPTAMRLDLEPMCRKTFAVKLGNVQETLLLVR
jgi:hypothetical protein